MALVDDIVRISPSECEALLDQAGREGWMELIILGPTIRLRDGKDGWPEDLRDAERIFQLRTEYPQLLEKVRVLSNLSTLNLWGNKLEKAEALTIAKELRALSSLNLGLSDLGDDGAAAIAELLPKLTILSLQLCNLSAEGAVALSARLNGLTMLDLGFNRIGQDGAIAISKALRNLTVLNLSLCNIGPDGANSIGRNLPSLTSLNVHSNGIGNTAAKTIASNLTKLTELFVQGNNIDDGGVEAIASSLPYLTKLHLGSNSISDRGAKAIARSLKGLCSLTLEDNRVGDSGANAIAVELPQLKMLDLGHNDLSDEGAKAILDVAARRETVDQFRKLNLIGNRRLSGALPAELLRLEDDPTVLVEMYQQLCDGETFMGSSRIKRWLEFQPQHRHACTNILNYFTAYLDQKYPDIEVAVEISQHGSIVRLTVETAEGDRDIVERTLEEYALVISGKLLPADVIEDRLAQNEMRQQLDILRLQLKWSDERCQLLADKADSLAYDKEHLSAQLDKLQRSLQIGLTNNRKLASALQALATSTRETSAQIWINRLFDLVECGLTIEDESAVRDIAEQLQKNDPATFEELVRIVRELAVGTTGSLLANWIGTAFAMLPKI